jgi:hypothetical protein
MSHSLRDQLLKAGLVTEKQARQAEQQARQDQRKQPKAPKGAPPARPSGASVQAQAAKQARDQELNRRKQEREAARARAAQVRQLIEQHRVPRLESDDYFNFQDGGKIRRIPVDADLRRRILQRELAIVGCEGHYALVPPDAAERIRERDPRAVVALPEDKPSTPPDDDPYKDFVVPDDLTW